MKLCELTHNIFQPLTILTSTKSAFGDNPELRVKMLVCDGWAVLIVAMVSACPCLEAGGSSMAIWSSVFSCH